METRDTTQFSAQGFAAKVLSSYGWISDYWLAAVIPVSLYPIAGGKKSVSFRVTYRSPGKTLEDDDVNDLHKTITERLLKALFFQKLRDQLEQYCEWLLCRIIPLRTPSILLHFR